MDPDNPLKALYIEFLKGYHSMAEPFDLTFDQMLLIIAEMIITKKFHGKRFYRFLTGREAPKHLKEVTVSIDEVVNAIVERSGELHNRGGKKL